MAKPAFIYAFDNLGPYQFTELCGSLLGSRYKGFLLGGVGPDGGIDAETDQKIGELQVDSAQPFGSYIIDEKQHVVFQFKHKVTARLGQAATRRDLLGLFKCTASKKCELHSDLILNKRPDLYVLVTNVEVNSKFRQSFVEKCREEQPDIKHYQIIGLDELEDWVTRDVQTRHLYFPTIFGLPRYDLLVHAFDNFIIATGNIERNPRKTLTVEMMNVGVATVYVKEVDFRLILGKGGQSVRVQGLHDFATDIVLKSLNAKYTGVVEPGRSQRIVYDFDGFCEGIEDFISHMHPNHRGGIFPSEVEVYDEIGNVYSEMIGEKLRESMLALWTRIP